VVSAADPLRYANDFFSTVSKSALGPIYPSIQPVLGALFSRCGGGLGARRLGFDSRQVHEMCLFSKASTLFPRGQSRRGELHPHTLIRRLDVMLN
jgi:hypothetical protein